MMDDVNFYGDLYGIARQTFLNQGAGTGLDQIRVRPYSYCQSISINPTQNWFSQLNDLWGLGAAPTNKHLAYYGNYSIVLQSGTVTTGAAQFYPWTFAMTAINPALVDTVGIITSNAVTSSTVYYATPQPVLFNYIYGTGVTTGLGCGFSFTFMGYQFAW